MSASNNLLGSDQEKFTGLIDSPKNKLESGRSPEPEREEGEQDGPTSFPEVNETVNQTIDSPHYKPNQEEWYKLIDNDNKERENMKKIRRETREFQALYRKWLERNKSNKLYILAKIFKILPEVKNEQLKQDFFDIIKNLEARNSQALKYIISDKKQPKKAERVI